MAGISKSWAIAMSIFEGIMDSKFYLDILKQVLIPFITAVYSQDAGNDPKHTSGMTKQFIADSASQVSWLQPHRKPLAQA